MLAKKTYRIVRVHNNGRRDVVRSGLWSYSYACQISYEIQDRFDKQCNSSIEPSPSEIRGGTILDYFEVEEES